MKEPTIEEVLELVSFKRYESGELYINNVNGNVWGKVCGGVEKVEGNVGQVDGDVGDVGGKVFGKILNK